MWIPVLRVSLPPTAAVIECLTREHSSVDDVCDMPMWSDIFYDKILSTVNSQIEAIK